ncbi:hypothetical protein [Chitinilyticum aquatile]|uniref:hypothetical protein n=1 Tax=Chitinilyticum aquatile TaxID=362520 RepID=UPI0012DEB540|nr:hypothetical protein [Chitinilyticum aquatile]
MDIMHALHGWGLPAKLFISGWCDVFGHVGCRNAAPDWVAGATSRHAGEGQRPERYSNRPSQIDSHLRGNDKLFFDEVAV